jgi:hypothetical protein
MTSDRKIASNRKNGRRSRGPQTAAGKASSSRNALQHGLSVSVLNEPAMCSEVETLARALAGDGADDAQLAHARIIAEAQLDLARIQTAKITIMNSHLMEAKAAIRGDDITMNLQRCDAAFESDNPSRRCTQELAMTPSIEILRQLSRLERYECRAISRRRRAMRAFLSTSSDLLSNFSYLG